MCLAVYPIVQVAGRRAPDALVTIPRSSIYLLLSYFLLIILHSILYLHTYLRYIYTPTHSKELNSLRHNNGSFSGLTPDSHRASISR